MGCRAVVGQFPPFRFDFFFASSSSMAPKGAAASALQDFGPWDLAWRWRPGSTPGLPLQQERQLRARPHPATPPPPRLTVRQAPLLTRPQTKKQTLRENCGWPSDMPVIREPPSYLCFAELSTLKPGVDSAVPANMVPKEARPPRPQCSSLALEYRTYPMSVEVLVL
jgi:hypothetical protein